MFKPFFNTDTDAFEIVQYKTVYQDYYRVMQYQIRHRLFSGEWSPVFSREVFEKGKAASVLLFDPDLNKIIFIEQFRAGIAKQTKNPWLLEIVAGVMESNENPEQLVIREVKEETGLTVKNVLPIYNYWVSPAASTEEMNLFCAQIDASVAGGIYGLKEENEDILVHVFDLQAAYALVEQGEIKYAPAIITLQWLRLHEKEVRDKFKSSDR